MSARRTTNDQHDETWDQRTEIVFIVDRSGSMCGLEADTIGGFASTLATLQADPGQARVTTVLFDHEYELLHDRVDLAAVAPLTRDDYWVRGSTALLDAIGRTVDKIVRVQRSVARKYRADKVMVVIITDGQENSSRHYALFQVRDMVRRQQEKHGWEFLFLGANMDAIDVATSVGIRPTHATNYVPDARGTDLAWGAAAQALGVVRRSPAAAPASIPADWNKIVGSDHAARS
ncbi:MAG: VWA domain-containing protein [Micrococcales bacterium]|nr:VWA domain-containing protein [Micrococcales bacterium]MCL2666534.1 VWA domain-containing protein [Micrococcales bacterium]